MTPVEASAPSMKKAQSKASTAGTTSAGPSVHGGVSATPLGAAVAVGRDAPAPLHACQEGENDFAEVAVVFEPQGTSLMMGGLHPRVRRCRTCRSCRHPWPHARPCCVRWEGMWQQGGGGCGGRLQ